MVGGGGGRGGGRGDRRSVWRETVDQAENFVKREEE